MLERLNDRPLIRITDLAADYARHQGAIDSAIRRVLEHGVAVAGPEVSAFESGLEAALGVRHAAGVASGSAALELALMACGVGMGVGVLTVANTDIASSAAIGRLGARVIWVDIDRRTFNIDPALLEERVTPDARALLVTHMHGYPADMDALLSIASRHDMVVIEDAALAWGALYDGRPVGTFGMAGCLSFAPTKVLGAFGDAGAVITDSNVIDRKVRTLASYGHRQPPQPAEDGLDWTFVAEGFNARMDEIHAAVLRARLDDVDDEVSRRRSIAAQYRSAFGDLPMDLPIEESGRRHVYRAFTIRTSSRERLRRHLAALGVETRTYYAPPLHLQPVYREQSAAVSLPVTEEVARTALSLPIHPGLTDDDVCYVIDKVRGFFGSGLGLP